MLNCRFSGSIMGIIARSWALVDPPGFEEAASVISDEPKVTFC